MKQTTTNRYMQFIKDNKIQLILLSIIFIFTIVPMIKAGIIINDELQHRFRAMLEPLEGYKTYFADLKRGGRLLGSATIPIIYLCGFMFKSKFFFDTLGVLAILSNIVLFGILIKTLTKNINFAFFTCAIFMMFLPVSFEHTIPNAYNFIFCTAISLLLISLLLFNKYLYNYKKRYLIISMILFLISLTIYELVLVYSVFYLILILIKTQNFKEICKHLIMPFVVGVFYLILYIASSKFGVSEYLGTSVATFDISKVLGCMKNFILGSLPGYVMLIPKNQYLLSIFSNTPSFISEDVIRNMLSSGDILKSLFYIIKSVAITFLSIINIKSIVLTIVSFIALKKFSVVQKNNAYMNKHIIVICISLIFIVLPALPQSLTVMYQEIFKDGIGPIYSASYFISFASIFLISYIIWNICIKNRALAIICILGLVGVSIPIQAMNSVFIEAQSANYKRITDIEDFFDTKTATLLEGRVTQAKDLYETKIALAIHDTYWDQYADKAKGLSIQTTNEISDSILYFNDEIFTLNIDNKVIVLSPNRLEGIYPVRIAENEFLAGNFENYVKDGSFYVYTFKKIENRLEPIELNLKFMQTDSNAKIDIVQGFYADGWIEKNASFDIVAKMSSKITILGYYPGVITGNEKISILVNDILQSEYTLTNSDIDIKFDIPVGEMANVKLISNFEMNAKGDSRELAFVVNDIKND